MRTAVLTLLSSMVLSVAAMPASAGPTAAIPGTPTVPNVAQVSGCGLTPSPIRISDHDRLTPETRAQIDLINVQIEQMRITMGNRQQYMGLPLP